MKRPTSVLTRALSAVALASFCAATLVAAEGRAEVVERVVAVVNDDAIFLSELRTKAGPYLPRAMGLPTEAQRMAAIDQIYGQVLELLIQQRLVVQAAEEEDITVTSADVEQALTTVRTESGLSEAEFWEAVALQGYATREEYRRDIRNQLIQYRVLNARVRGRVNITLEDVRRVYDERVARSRRSLEYVAADIIVRFPRDAGATDITRARREAEAIRASIETADDFDDAMEEHNGMELGRLAQGDLEPVLEEAIAGLEDGQITPAIQGTRGFHIILLRAREMAESDLGSFESLQNEIYQEMLREAMETQQRLFLEELRRAAHIEVRL
jgi:peptidyl-prolyl cis-trans isomerase SurA